MFDIGGNASDLKVSICRAFSGTLQHNFAVYSTNNKCTEYLKLRMDEEIKITLFVRPTRGHWAL